MRYVFFLAIIVWGFSCKTKSAMPKGCTTLGVVKDFSGLDGCGLMIELENGDLFNPVELKDGMALKANQHISFSYEKLEDMMGSCMRESAMVKITCYSELGKTPEGDALCANAENPFEIDWMDHAIDLHNPNQILKYSVGNEWTYLFRSIPSSFYYDCRGKLICETKSDHDKCQMQHLSNLGQGKVIWQGEGVWD